MSLDRRSDSDKKNRHQAVSSKATAEVKPKECYILAEERRIRSSVQVRNFTCFLESHSSDRYPHLRTELERNPHLSPSKPKTALRCLEELSAIENSLSWGRRICLLNKTNSTECGCCEPSFAQIIGFCAGRTERECFGFGISEIGFFIRSTPAIRLLACLSDEIEIVQFDEHGDDKLVRLAKRSELFRSSEFKQTRHGADRFEFHDLRSKSTFSAPKGINEFGVLSDCQNSAYPARLTIGHRKGQAGDYGEVISFMRKVFLASIQMHRCCCVQ